MDILEMVGNVCDNDLLIKNHQVKELGFEKKLLYMHGLSLMMNVDNEIHPKEIEFLEMLIKAFELEDNVDVFIEFAKNPDSKVVADIMNFLKDFELKKLFLFDAIVLSKVDNVEKECEEQLLKMFTAKANLLQKDIRKFSFMIDAVIENANNDELSLSQMIKRVYHPLNIKKIVAIDKSWTSPKSEMEFVFVENGSFQMGSDNENNEKPIHEVTLTNDFWCGKYPVTQQEYKKIMGYNPSHFKGDKNPVETVSWNDAVNFCNKLTEQEQFNNSIPEEMEYRLLTEAEWEYCAKGGNKSVGYKYSGSDDVNLVAWYSGNSDSKTHSVGEKEQNEIGLFDMTGNVGEWCNDWYGGYASESVNNPKEVDSGTNRILRGGYYSYSAAICRSAYRNNTPPSITSSKYGFRIALAQKELSS